MVNAIGPSPLRWSRHLVVLSLLIIGSLLLSACDLGGGSAPPATSNQNPPTQAQQFPTNPPAAQGNGGQTNNGASTPAGGTGSTGGTQAGGTGSTGSTPAGGTGGTGSTGSTPAGGSGTANTQFNKIAAAMPVAGTDPSQQPIVQMVQRVGPAVVTVVNSLNPSLTGGQRGEARGTGAIIDQQGHIVTNNHVVEGEAQLVVIFSNGQKQQVRLIGTDPDHDLAVLQATGPMPAVVPMGDSDKLLPGEVVIAIGSALGEFQNTVTVGVVSGLHRDLPESDAVTLQNLIQTDAAINHGNSGGPLLNLDGELVGINTLGVTQAGQGDIAQGLGFAIPSSSVKVVAAQILRQPVAGGGTGGSGQTAPQSGRPFLGVTIQPLDPRLAAYYNLVGPDGQLLQDGALVTAVTAGAPAATAGIQPGDVIVAVDGQAVTANTPLGDLLSPHQPGDKLSITLVRAGKQGTATVTLAKHP